MFIYDDELQINLNLKLFSRHAVLNLNLYTIQVYFFRICCSQNEANQTKQKTFVKKYYSNIKEHRS